MNTQDKIMKLVVDKLKLLIKKNGVLPWMRPWASVWPINLETYKSHVNKLGEEETLHEYCYKGINAMLLGALGYESPFFLTYQQATKLGGQVKKGEHGFPVIFWKIWNKEHTKDNGESETKHIPLLRYSTVFNVSQIENLLDLPQLTPKPTVQGALNEAIEKLIVSDFNPETSLGGNEAYYDPTLDGIQLPARNQFDSLEAFYGTWAHEAGHGTGHISRLARPDVVDQTVFSSRTAYSEEELVAAITASMFCSGYGIWYDDLQQQDANYVGTWLARLENDPKILLRAASAATKAVRWITTGSDKVVEDIEDNEN